MSPAAGYTITLLTPYFAVLILAVQYVSDRYSPALNSPVLSRGALVPSVVHFARTVVAALLPIQGRAAELMVTTLGMVLIPPFKEGVTAERIRLAFVDRSSEAQSRR